MVSLCNAQYQLETILGPMWGLQAAREAFAVAAAGESATSGKSSAAAEIDGLLEAVLQNVDKLVHVLEQERSEAVTHDGGDSLVKQALLPALLQQLQECV